MKGNGWTLDLVMRVRAAGSVTYDCDSSHCSLPGSFVHRIVRRENCCYVPLQGIFPTAGSNLRLLLWQADPQPLSYLGSLW